MNRKQTAWKKSRKFGDKYGGRERLKLDDNIFKRYHSLKKPSPADSLPILIEDNPSRDFFFPISAQEALEALKALPKEDYEGITHIWCRRAKKSEYINGELPWASFICGSGVRLITLYPWPKHMTVSWAKKPANRFFNDFRRFDIEIVKNKNKWIAKPTLLQLRKLYVEYLLYHEIGRHNDWYCRHWSKANKKQSNEFADQYAIHKTLSQTYQFNPSENFLVV